MILAARGIFPLQCSRGVCSQVSSLISRSRGEQNRDQSRSVAVLHTVNTSLHLNSLLVAVWLTSRTLLIPPYVYQSQISVALVLLWTQHTWRVCWVSFHVILCREAGPGNRIKCIMLHYKVISELKSKAKAEAAFRWEKNAESEVDSFHPEGGSLMPKELTPQ